MDFQTERPVSISAPRFRMKQNNSRLRPGLEAGRLTGREVPEFRAAEHFRREAVATRHFGVRHGHTQIYATAGAAQRAEVEAARLPEENSTGRGG